MRAVLVAALFLPLAGCLGTPGLEAAIFAYQPIQLSDPDPVAVGNCTVLLESLNQRALDQAKVSMHQDYRQAFRPWWGWEGDVVFAAQEEAADASGAPSSPRGEREATGTNNQEAAVDEADLLKTDGTWTYVLDGNALHILLSNDVGNLTGYSKMDIGTGWGAQLLLVAGDPATDADDRLVVIAHDDDWQRDTYRQSTIISIVDLADRRAPAIVDQHRIDGHNVGARLVGGVAYIVVYNWGDDLGLRTWVHPTDDELKERGLTWEQYWDRSERSRNEIRLEIAEQAIEDNERVAAGLTINDHLPAVERLVGDVLRPVPYTDARCRSVLSAQDDTGRGTNTILAIDVHAGAASTTQILSDQPIVYGAEDALVLASASQGIWWLWAQPDLDESTNLHWFDLDELNVSHRASGRVDGTVLDQFSLDVTDDTLRVITTTGRWGRWWVEDPEPMANHLAVFGEEGGELVERGRVSGIAPDERVWSARFTDDRVYIVTFQEIDPLWVIDLQDPRNPTILGELEIPGVSTYIHPLSDDLLLTIGMGPGPNGLGLDWSALQVSLFDISDPTAPRQADVLRVSPPGGSGWSWSAALHEHKAFTYWDKIDMLAIPVASTTYERYWDSSCNEGQGCWRSDPRYFSGVRLINVDQDAMAFSLHGTVDQDALLQDGARWPGYYGIEVQRTFFLGYPDTYPVDPVSIYAMSGLGMTAHDLQSLDLQAAVSFESEYRSGGELEGLLREV